MNIDRDSLIAKMKFDKIDTRPFFYPLSSLPMFDSVPDNTVAYSLYARGINLPSYHDMSRDEVAVVVSSLKRHLNNLISKT